MYECGATIDENELICQNCGAKNEDAIEAVQEDAIRQYEELAARIQEEIPTVTGGKSSRIVLYIALGLFVLLMIAMNVAWFV